MAEIENVPSSRQASATPSGQRRRHHSETQASAPQADVDDDLRGRQRVDAVVQRRAQEERPERGGDEAPDGVDGPVATGPRTGRVRLGQIAWRQQRRRPHQLDPQPG